MSDNGFGRYLTDDTVESVGAPGFGRYLTDEYKAKGRSEQAEQRRAGERPARDARRAAEQRRAEIAEVIREDEAGCRSLAGLLVDQDVTKDEVERCGRGFGRYLV